MNKKRNLMGISHANRGLTYYGSELPYGGDVSDPNGVVFRRVSDGSRSSKRAGTAILGAALEPLNPRHAAMARQEQQWRQSYPRHFRRLVEDSLMDAELALASAQAGLNMAWRCVRWAQGGQEHPLEWAAQPGAVAAAAAAGETLATHTLRGTGDAAPAPWVVPYRGKQLSGAALDERIDAWARGGIIEPGAAAALHRCSQNPEWFDLSDRTMVLLGAGSEAGPLPWLARWRANLVAVDIYLPAVWHRIAAIVQGGNATMHLPLQSARLGDSDWVEAAGVDLLTQAPAIAHWICGFDAQLDVAAHAYLDGERHLRLALAMDLIQRQACAGRPGTTLAFMATPTDVFAVPHSTALAAMQGYRQRPVIWRVLQELLRMSGGERFFQPGVTQLLETPGGNTYGVIDSLVMEQGPNYALAKRLQQWRAMLARAAGHRVSLNIAPSTTTASVVTNPALAAGFAGASRFGIEAFAPQTTSALMAALWVHDLRCEASPANPLRPLAHPLEHFMENACHGGMWRCPYLPRSALPFAAALGFMRGGTRRAGPSA